MKNRMNIALRSAVCILLLSSLLLGSCSSGTVEETTADTTASQTESTALVTEDVPEDTTEAPSDDTTAEDTTEADTEEVIPAGPTVVINPLTGIESAVDYMSRRPVAIMINNVRTTVGGQTVLTAQHGIINADLMYECVVEGGLTRLMMVVSDWESLPEIGSVRSSREYFLDFASNHDAIYVHAGGSTEAYNQINNVRNTDNIDFVNPVNGVSMYAYNYRNQELLNKGYLLEHTLMTTGKMISDAIGRMRYRTDLNASLDSPLDFVPFDETKLPEGGDATYLQVRYSSGHTPYYRYDDAKGTYKRYQYGAAHIDQATGEQLAFDNIVLLYCPSYNTHDDKQHQSVTTTGTGTGYYLTQGKYEEITWKKASVGSPVKLYDINGNELLVNRGKTFFQICETHQSEHTVIS